MEMAVHYFAICKCIVTRGGTHSHLLFTIFRTFLLLLLDIRKDGTVMIPHYLVDLICLVTEHNIDILMLGPP